MNENLEKCNDRHDARALRHQLKKAVRVYDDTRPDDFDATRISVRNRHGNSRKHTSADNQCDVCDRMGCNRCISRHRKSPKNQARMVGRDFRLSDHRRGKDFASFPPAHQGRLCI